mgnify:CR=1 FL=1
MFGYLCASHKELDEAQKRRYGAVYCGICRRIRMQSRQMARLTLQYDMAFLALLLMSLYEPEDEVGTKACSLHPIKKRPWVDNEYIRYCADLNVALAYYKCLDDWFDDHSLTAKAMAGYLKASMPAIEGRYPRQCGAIGRCIEQLRLLEEANCPNPDESANCFGALMAELLVYREDLWAPTLREMGMALGRFIYLLDAALDYEKDEKKGKYNPFLAMGTGKDWPRWEEYLLLTMGRCTDAFEKLPLVQDKAILDNILYSGIWLGCRKDKKEESADDHGSV